MERKQKIIVGIMILAVLLAINVHQIKVKFHYEELALSTFIEAGVPESFMETIDFSKPVKIYHVKEGDVFIQWQVEGAPQGNFYGHIFSDPDELGISFKGSDGRYKKKRLYVATKDFDMLSSYAAPIKDTWSNPDETEELKGGDLQFFTTCKPCFKEFK